MTPRILINLLLATLFVSKATAQFEQGNSNIQAGGGWTSVNITSNAELATGYIINAQYENFLVSSAGIGASIHYLRVSDMGNNASGTGTSLPIFLNAKYYFGKNNLRVFGNVSAGFQFSWRKLEDISGNTGSDHDSGIAAGFGTGVVYCISPKLLFNLNYHLYWMRNAYYSDGLANTITLNLGFIIGN
jgi:outer membrane protein W